MSYCRFGWEGSDVYVYQGQGGFVCCGCSLSKRKWDYKTIEKMIAHLAKHRRAGQFVPFYAIQGLWEDIPGPDVPVTPEPPELTESRLKIEKIIDEKHKSEGV